MARFGTIAYLATFPNQLRSIISWKLWHEPVHRRNPKKESRTQKACFYFLNLASRTFSASIQELNPELLLPVCLFYLTLRGLDTIEDDMTIDIAKKEPLLRNFANTMDIDGWTFTENGPNEKDRELLVHFDDIIAELKRMNCEYYAIVRDITVKMGNGMADYALNAEYNEKGIMTVLDYELYCHYVAGLVGEGLTRLFVQAKLADPQLMNQMDLSESMGQFLQKANILRDIHEDFTDGRRFWPWEVWSKYVDRWEDVFDPKYRQQALYCSSELVLNALKHVNECLLYMTNIRDQSVFNFVAIPQSIAIATLELVFNNPDIFESHIRITKGDACKLMTESTQNLRTVCGVFRRYIRRIYNKNDPRDPQYLAIGMQCDEIEQFIESMFPTQNTEEAMGMDGKKAARDQYQVDTTEVMMLVGAVIFTMLLTGNLMIGWAYVLS